MSAVAYSRVSAVVISGSDNISLSNVSIHNIGGSAVTISGSHNSVSDSSVQYVGCTGISVDVSRTIIAGDLGCILPIVPAMIV